MLPIQTAYRKFPQDKVACIPQAEVATPVQAFANVSAFPDLPARLVFLFLGGAHLAEVDLDVGRKLKSRPVERPGFLL